MFELPTNTTPQVRPEIVNRMVAAMFRTKVLKYCDTHVQEGNDAFCGHWDQLPGTRFTEDERKAAFEEFRKKGYHIARETWYGAHGQLWNYVLMEQKDVAEDRQFHYLF